jgi:hypothetical protein
MQEKVFDKCAYYKPICVRLLAKYERFRDIIVSNRQNENSAILQKKYFKKKKLLQPWV